MCIRDRYEAYAGGGRGDCGNDQKQKTNKGSLVPAIRGMGKIGLQPKNLIMMPARIANALQDDGWRLRSEIVWAKPNPMPESVKDRPVCAHEKIFLLTKSKRYFYDAEAVRTPEKESTKARLSQPRFKTQTSDAKHTQHLSLIHISEPTRPY